MKVICFMLSLFSDLRAKPRHGFALIKLGGAVADIRGSVGGTVYSRNRYGAYSRNRTIPVNPASEAQTKIRSIMGQIRNAWFNTLSQANRDAWDAYASAVTMTNRVGESVKLTGWNHFARSAAALLYNDEAIVKAGPVELALPEVDSTITGTVSAGAGTVSLAFDNTQAWAKEAGGHLLVYASRGCNSTVNFFKGPYRVAGKVNGASPVPPTSPAVINLPFDVLAGQKVFLQCRIVRADGRLSQPFRLSDIAGA